MPNNKVTKSYKLFSLHIPLLALTALLVVGGYIYSEKANNTGGFVLGEKSKDAKTKTTKPTKNLPEKKLENMPDKSVQKNLKKLEQQPVVKNQEVVEKPKTSASPINKGNARTVAEKIILVADHEEKIGNSDVSADLEYASTLINDVNEGETAEILEEIESRPKWQTLLVGTDYKNLGQLRSEMVQNRNTIRKLTKSMEHVQSDEGALLLQQQIDTLELQQTQIQTVLTEKESQFSILGWVSRFLSGYDKTDVEVPQNVIDADESTETTGF